MVDAPERIWAYPSNVTGWNNPFCRTTPASQLVIEYIRADLAPLSDAVAERVAEPVASVAEVRADGQRLYNTVYPSDALDKFPIGTLLYASPPTSELEALRKRVAELEKPSREKFYYPIVMPVDADGQGPADIKDAAKLTWEVWDQELTRHGSFDFLADAIDLANELNARRVREGGKVDG